METQELDESPIENGIPVIWEGPRGLDLIGVVISYLGEGLMLVQDDENKEYEVDVDSLVVIE